MRLALMLASVLLLPQAASAAFVVYSTPGSSTFTVPSGVTQIRLFVIGGGGGGGGGNAGWGSGSGGGCGGAVNGGVLNVTPGQQFAMTVGAGGAGGGAAGNGGTGGTTVFGSISAAGGSWGRSGYYNFTGSYGGAGGGSGGGGGGNGWPGFYALSSPGGTSGSTHPYVQPSQQTTGSYDENGNYYEYTYTQGPQSPGGCRGNGWSINPGTYITKTTWSAGSGGPTPVTYNYWGGGGGGGVVINNSSVNGGTGGGGCSGSGCPGQGGAGYGGGGGGTPVDYYVSGGTGAPGAVYVEWEDQPATCSVTLNPTAVNRGSAATLSWSSSGATSVYINNVGYVLASGSTSVSPLTTTDYSCTASGPGGSAGWQAASLTVYQPCTLDGTTVTHGNSVTAYQNSSVSYGNTCVSQSRTCTNGTLSGTYAYRSCSVAPAANCTLGGTTVNHGSSATFYSSQIAPSGQTCSNIAQSRTCTNGSLSGSASYQYGSCSCAPQYYCSGNTVMRQSNTCTASEVVECTSPGFCTAGQSTCQYSNMSYGSFDSAAGSEQTGELSARPQIVPEGTSVTLYWNVANAQSCTVVGDNGDSWSSAFSGAAGRRSLPILERTAYTITCNGYPDTVPASISKSIYVNILPIFGEF